MASAYPTIAEFKAVTDISSTSDDTLIQTYLDNAKQTIEDMAGRKFGVSGTSVRYYDAREAYEDGRLLVLDEDLVSLTSIVNGDGTSIATGDVFLLPFNDSPKTEILIKETSASRWTWGTNPENSVEITGVWGFSTTVPDPVYQATMRLAAFFYYQRDTSLDVDRPILTATGLYMPSRIPSDVQMLIYPYSRLT